MRFSAQNLPILSATLPLIKAPMSAPTGINPPSVEASFNVIELSSGESDDLRYERYGEVHTIDAPTPRVKIFTDGKIK